jgi:NAD(P)-dependent dehydrogenase (short-subunit alcohol dehydrogenase family)
MPDTTPPVAIVAGIGPTLGSALARRLAHSGYRVAGLARSTGTMDDLAAELNADQRVFLPIPCDLTDPAAVSAAVAQVRGEWGPARVYVHNAARFLMKPFLDTTAEDFEVTWRVTTLGAFNGARAVLPDMLNAGQGSLLLIGATAAVKPAANFAAFGSAKAALRGLAHALAREHGPRGVHVAHLIIDGVMWSPRARDEFGMREEQCLAPDPVAETCLHLIAQPRSAWTLELDLRPDVERF